MSDSREQSPDWLRTFQAPTQSTLTLSSDSELSPKGSPSSDYEPSPKGSPSRADIFDLDEPTPDKSSKIPEKDMNQGIVLGESGAGSSSSKPSKAKSAKRRLKVEDQTPRQKKNTANKKRKRGDESDKKVAKEESLEKNIEPHEPNASVLTLSSDSESGQRYRPINEDQIHHGESSDQKTSEFQGGAKGDDDALIGSDGESPSKKAAKEKSPRKRLKVEGHTAIKEKKINENIEKKDTDTHTHTQACTVCRVLMLVVSVNGVGKSGNVEIAEEETSHMEPRASSSRLPLVLSDKVQRTKALIECEGDAIDLSGDMGAVGRIIVSDTPSGNHDLYLDLKGTIYQTTIVPSRTFCVVSFGQSEAKIEAIMNDFIQLNPQSNVYEAETMVEGTMDGFLFDSDDEADKMPKAISSNQNDQDIEGQTNGKIKGKAEKKSGGVRKRGKTAGGKTQAPKRVRKKNQVSKKGKSKK
ncbi:DNA-binding protein BIN4 isoform X1 [Quercus lobata]|uniref:DNA-binding protein BIN4 isoform X1 n=1 Tax=Quercus lobata TaxID=97700 RepID=UPI00124538CA|nr:DNA-binding protein BIN4 isoform X1 [Quercus lobata]XP_030936942.1 DNA-binding protein BIN4 isoform X1 [Quercus lobata]XP_030936943.1 DNA-binding protein BIN4 isoform X1 [Quercus lobata]